MLNKTHQDTVDTSEIDGSFVRNKFFPELTCPMEHAAFAAVWAKQVIPAAHDCCYRIATVQNDTRHLSLELQEYIAKAMELAHILEVELRNIQHKADQEVNEVSATPQPALPGIGRSESVSLQAGELFQLPGHTISFCPACCCVTEAEHSGYGFACKVCDELLIDESKLSEDAHINQMIDEARGK